MKKMILMLMAMMMAMTALPVMAEETPETTDELILAEGFVLEVLDGSVLVQASYGETVEVLLNEETIITSKELAVGDHIAVAYDGKMTRSIPPQINAIHIDNHMLMGVVSELTENSFILTFGEEVYQVNAGADMLANIQDGMLVTVYHTCMMTRSLPAQVVATHIRGQEIVGIVTEMVEGGFTLTVEGEEIPYHVAIKEDARLFVQAEPGMEVIVITDGLMTSSLESILVNAAEILPLPAFEVTYDQSGVVTEIGEGFIMIEAADGQTIQANMFEETLVEGKEIEAGDFIHVTFGGMMTFSLPAQIAAQKIGCYAHTGVVGEITEGQFALETEMEQILVNAPAELLEGIKTGMNVTVYTNGAMTMSLPAQVGAEMIAVTETIVD